MKHAIEIEIDDPKNCDLFFFPLKRRIRGRFDARRVKDPQRTSAPHYETPFPGQVLGVDADGCYVREPLQADENRRLKEWIESQGYGLADERERIAGANPNEWLYWMRRAVDGGHATLQEGQLPETVDYQPPGDYFGQAAKSREDVIKKRLAEDPDFALRWAQATEKQREAVLSGSL